ncbi:MAG TPA: primosomal protein N' [Hyphomicrobiaceae bacterium]|nr:primosomal protein N' [Hyphomicrobiaceae bacterium]
MLAPLETDRGSAAASTARMPVLLPVALEHTYDYRLPDGVDAPIGAFVLVPFGPQQRIGVVWDRSVGDSGKPVADDKLKAITAALADVAPLPALSMRFAEWVARYTLAPLGMVLRMMMGAPAVFEPSRPRIGVVRNKEAPEPPRMTPARRRALQIAADGLVRAKLALATEAACSTGVIDGLIAAGTLIEVAIPERRLPVPNPHHTHVDFSAAQAPAVHALRAAADAESFSVTLLDGVTGSGKTEVYFEAVARTLERGRQALIMLPEIALTSQFMDRFAARFGCAPVEWHSALSPAERARAWRATANGQARVVVGARSALFLPYQDLGLIVIDEEHDGGFKQEDRVHYQARDMAVVRGSLAKHAVVLASATPSIESHVNARSGRYGYVGLPGRYFGAQLPDVATVDLRQHPPERGKWLSPVLVAAMAETLEKTQQVLLFLNRRGYAPLTLCRACGHRIDCPQCTAWLVEHRYRRRLTCHHCGFALPIPEKCPKCGEPDALVACGPGVERIAEEVAERFPQARRALLSSDLVPSLIEMREIIKKIEVGEADIIIGTQMVAKGHHFPQLALVGIVDGDLGLGQADPRAPERTFQLMHQVTGRAGRELAAGRGYVQTYMPEHPVMQAIISGDREAFLAREIRQRQSAQLPPFGRLAALVISARDKELAELFARDVARHAPPADRIEVLGPAEAPLAVIRGRHRWRLLVKAPRDLDLQAYLRAWLNSLPKPPADLRLTVDVDPYSFL